MNIVYIYGRICAEGKSIDHKCAKTINICIQGYPQRMRLQRRFCGICLVRFLAFRFPCRPKLAYYVLNNLVNHQNNYLNVKTKIQASNRHIFRVLGRLCSVILGGSTCIYNKYTLLWFTYFINSQWWHLTELKLYE